MIARAKWLAGWRAVLKYLVRVTFNPFAASIAQLLPFFMSGSVNVSIVLDVPTVGPLLFTGLIDQ